MRGSGEAEEHGQRRQKEDAFNPPFIESFGARRPECQQKASKIERNAGTHDRPRRRQFRGCRGERAERKGFHGCEQDPEKLTSSLPAESERKTDDAAPSVADQIPEVAERHVEEKQSPGVRGNPVSYTHL